MNTNTEQQVITSGVTVPGTQMIVGSSHFQSDEVTQDFLDQLDRVCKTDYATGNDPVAIATNFKMELARKLKTYQREAEAIHKMYCHSDVLIKSYGQFPSIKEELQVLKPQLAKFEYENRQYKQELTVYQKKVSEAESSLKNIQISSNKSTTEVTTLKQSIQSEISQKQAFMQQAEMYKKQSESYQMELNSKQQESTNYQRQIQTLTRTNRDLTDEKDNLQIQLENQVKLLGDYKDAHSSQQESISVGQFELAKYQNELAQYQNMYQSIVEQKEHMEAELVSVKQTLSASYESNQKLQVVINTKTTELSQHGQQSSKAESQVKQYTQRVTEMENQMQAQGLAYQRIESQLLQSQKDLIAQKNQCQKYQQDIEQYKGNEERYVREKQVLEQKVSSESSTTNVQTTMVVNEMQSAISEKDQQIAYLGQEIEGAKLSYQQLMESSSGFQAQINELTTHISSLELQNSELMRELDSFVQSNEAIKERLDYKSRYENLRGKYASNLSMSYKMRPVMTTTATTSPMINFGNSFQKKASFNTGFAVNSKFVNGSGLSGGAAFNSGNFKGFSSKAMSYSASPKRVTSTHVTSQTIGGNTNLSPQ